MKPRGVMDGCVGLHFHVQSSTRSKTFGSWYRVEQHHTSKAANLRCTERCFRTFSTWVVRRALSKWTTPAVPEPGSYWGAQVTQGQGRKQTNVCGTPPTASAATSWPQPTTDLLQGVALPCSRKRVATVHVAPSATGTKPWVTAIPARRATVINTPRDSSKGRWQRHTR